jgi:7-keto-8-aminopelargonate synthetase-like enzyme
VQELNITVPKGLGRLRVSINVGHGEGDFIKLGKILKP